MDGVPCFWADLPGPFHAGLIFRVGVIDETLPWRGITHLVEHLALSTLGRTSFGFNGQVDLGFTMFHATGESAEVTWFLEAVTAGISNLPEHRLEHEVRVLRTEAASRGPWIFGPLFSYRYGPRGPGLIAYEEYGFFNAQHHAVQEWARRAFTATNAVLVLSGPVPDGIRLHLGSGTRWAWPSTPPLQQPLPTFVRHAAHVAGFTFHAPRGAPSMALQALLEMRLQDRLRTERGITYGVGATAELVEPELLQIGVAMDLHKEFVNDGIHETVDVITDLIQYGPYEDELDYIVQRFEAAFADPGSTGAMLYTAARDELLGRPQRSYDEVIFELQAVTSDAVGDLLDSSIASSLWVMPQGAEPPPWRFLPFIDSSPIRVEGRRLRLSDDESALTQLRRLREGGKRHALVVGDQGLTLEFPNGTCSTVLFDHCAAVLAASNGERMLIGEDGFTITVVPAEWREGWEAVRRTDARVSRDRYVVMR